MTAGPVLKGMNASLFKTHITVGLGLSIAGGLLYWFGYNSSYERRVQNYYKKIQVE